jgi:hypothetical protein
LNVDRVWIWIVKHVEAYPSNAFHPARERRLEQSYAVCAL